MIPIITLNKLAYVQCQLLVAQWAEYDKIIVVIIISIFINMVDLQ